MNKYIEEEQPNTDFKLSKKIHTQYGNLKNDVMVHIDCSKLNNQNFQIITQISEILQDSGEVGEFDLDIFNIKVNSLQTYEKDLIVCKTK